MNLHYEKIFVSFALQNPELLTSIGIAEQFGYRRHNAHLADASVQRLKRDFVAWHGDLEDLKAYDIHRQEDRFFKRPFSLLRHPERGRTEAERSARSA